MNQSCVFLRFLAWKWPTAIYHLNWRCSRDSVESRLFKGDLRETRYFWFISPIIHWLIRAQTQTHVDIHKHTETRMHSCISSTCISPMLDDGNLLISGDLTVRLFIYLINNETTTTSRIPRTWIIALVGKQSLLEIPSRFSLEVRFILINWELKPMGFP